MNIESAREYCLRKKAVTECFPFDEYSLIEGAYHFHKKYWNQVYFDRDADDKLIKQLIDHSYDEVMKKFTKKLRTEYDALP